MKTYTLPQRIKAIVIGLSLLAPSMAISQTTTAPYEQEFVITAYYSPLPDQCCYVRGSYEADVILNGQGTHGADGTPVYPGMIAAPPSYAFGTRIALPGLGTVTVHDRGGAIQEWDDAHRLDVWVGSGEEGLARALEFGIRRVKGTVYPLGSSQPPEAIDLEALPASYDKLAPLMQAETDLLEAQPSLGEKGLSVRMMQEHLAAIGLFDHAVTGLFGPVTAQALGAFVHQQGLQEPTDKLTATSAAYLMAAASIEGNLEAPFAFIDADSNASDIRSAQRLLRFLGHYRGRTDGIYNDALFGAILSYQKEQQLVAGDASPGAGRIGPQTLARLQAQMNRRRIAMRAQVILQRHDIEQHLAEKGLLVPRFLARGSGGDDVKTLQRTLANLGYFPAAEINGNYGPLTEAAVLQYQLDHGIIAAESDTGAGRVGPATLTALRSTLIRSAELRVKAQGWNAL